MDEVIGGLCVPKVDEVGLGSIGLWSEVIVDSQTT